MCDIVAFLSLIVIFMFGDMAHLAVSTKDNGRFCENDDLAGPTLDFCNAELTSSYLRVYVRTMSGLVGTGGLAFLTIYPPICPVNTSRRL